MGEKYEIEMDLYGDWISFLKSRLQEMKCSINKTHIPGQVSLGYFNLLKRRILPRPRQIMISKEFSCPPEHQKGLEKLKEKIKRGEDLSPHLSKKIVELDKNDLLLNDWGIYHLHLGTDMEAKGFVKRTGPALFARFTEEVVFLINVMKHGKGAPSNPWTNQQLIDTLHKNWPESIRDFRVNGVWLPKNHSDDDIEYFRQRGIQTFIQIEDVVYSPMGGGYSISGMSTDAQNSSNIHTRTIKDLEQYIRDNYIQLIGVLEQKGITFSSKLKFRLVIDGLKVEILEEYSQQTWETLMEFKDGRLIMK